MSDLISRQAAIDALGDAHFKNYGNAIMVIQTLPSAEPQWIQVSERLPKESGIYLVTVKTDGVEYFESEFPNGFVYVSTYDAVIMNWGYGGKNVIAWMPLPEPYEGDKE